MSKAWYEVKNMATTFSCSSDIADSMLETIFQAFEKELVLMQVQA